MTGQEAQEKLEQMVDAMGLAQVLANLAAVCYAKDLHIAETWQDRSTAAVWRKAGWRVERVAAAIFHSEKI